MASHQSKRTLIYGHHSSLQTITVTPLDQQKDGYWVIYIHGGAWRDPTITAETIEPTQSILQASPDLPIAGFASIEYRLSAHPNHPQDQATTPPEEYRDAKHPDHIRDVGAALDFLQDTYGFGQRYILVGHSCGATLAFQAVMGTVTGDREQLFNGSTEPVTSSLKPLAPRLTAQPTAIVGVAGIYDLRQIVETNRDIPEYRRFVEGAFGTDELLWDAVSPAQMVRMRGVEGEWKTGRLVVLAHSKDDELVDPGQLETMREALRAWEGRKAQVAKQELPANDRRVEVLTLSGEHDEVWSKGEELARAVKFAFAELQKMGLSPVSELIGREI